MRLILIVAVDDAEQANADAQAFAAALGIETNLQTFSTVRLSADGQEPATHLACSWGFGPGVDLEVFSTGAAGRAGFDPAVSAAALALGRRLYDGASVAFGEALADAGLQRTGSDG